MFGKICFVLMLAVGVFSLECVFEVTAGASNLNIKGGVDQCDYLDAYCATVDVNGVQAKGCSRTSLKIGGQGFPVINCDQEGCNAQGSLCCCKGNKCNGSATTSAVSLIVLPIAMLLL